MSPTLTLSPPTTVTALSAYAVFSVKRTGDVSGPTVADYDASPYSKGQVFFGGGESLKEIWVPITPDALFVTVRLLSATGATIMNPQATVQTANPPPLTLPRTLVWSWDFVKDGLPPLWSRSNPSGWLKTNMYFGGDNRPHSYQGVRSLWPDAASSRAGTEDLQTYSDVPYNGVQPFRITSEGLVITVAPNPTPTVLTPQPYTGGLVTSELSLNARYAFWLFKGARLAGSRGTWPGLWLLDAEHTGLEIDVEALGGDPRTLHFNAHYPDDSGTMHSVPEGTWTGDLTKPHDIGIMMTAASIAWYVDGIQVYSVDNPGFHTPMYFLVDNAAGPKDGGWAAINTPLALPGDMALAGIEVYSV